MAKIELFTDGHAKNNLHVASILKNIAHYLECEYLDKLENKKCVYNFELKVDFDKDEPNEDYDQELPF